METIEKENIQSTEQVGIGIRFCRKLMSSQRQMQEEANEDWYDPRIQAIIEKQKEKLRNETT